MGLTIGNNYNSLNYSISSTSTKKNDSVTSQEESSSDITDKKKSPHLCTIKFVEEGNSGIYEGYVDGIKMDENFMKILDMWQNNSSNTTQILSRINKSYDKTDAEKLKEIFRL